MTQNAWNTPYSSANGQLLIGSGSGRPAWATLTQGDATTITNGAGSITVAFDAASGDFEFISSATASGSSEITFTGLSSTYDTYMITMQGVQPSTDGSIMQMQTSTDGGSTYDSGASDYAWNSAGTNDGGTIDPEGSTGDTKIGLAGEQGSEELGSGTNETLAGNIWMYNLSDTEYSKFNFNFSYLDLVADHCSLTGGGARLSAADVDAVRIFMDSGNISTGTFKLYGYKA